jgi:hypothetical protein
MKNFRSITPLLILVFVTAAAIPIWIWLIAPQFTKVPGDFHYEVEIFSLDNFYDEELGDFSGEEISVTQFSYGVVDKQGGVLIVKNIFDARTVTGEKIFAVERLYGIDANTGRHLPGFGDKDREGYMFAPRRLGKDEPFTYWHINYDGPALMKFIEEEDVLGLTVYRYESRYEGVDIDQTAELGHLPGVPETRGVNLDPYLKLWIEPKTGRMIKYEDQTTAYYYDIKTGERLNPWNSFGNRFSQSSIAEQVRLAKKDIQHQTIVNIYVPVVLALLALVFLVVGLVRRKVS